MLEKTMPAIGNIVINDAATTPLAHTFSPVTTDGQTGQLANRAAAIPSGYEKLKMEMRPPSSPTAAYSLLVDMTNPVVGTVDGAQTVVRSNNGNLRLNFGPQSTVQERKDQLKLWQNLLGHATTIAMVTDVEPLY
jgi:hypothetical protein